GCAPLQAARSADTGSAQGASSSQNTVVGAVINVVLARAWPHFAQGLIGRAELRYALFQLPTRPDILCSTCSLQSAAHHRLGHPSDGELSALLRRCCPLRYRDRNLKFL